MTENQASQRPQTGSPEGKLSNPCGRAARAMHAFFSRKFTKSRAAALRGREAPVSYRSTRQYGSMYSRSHYVACFQRPIEGGALPAQCVAYTIAWRATRAYTAGCTAELPTAALDAPAGGFSSSTRWRAGRVASPRAAHRAQLGRRPADSLREI